MQYSVVVVIAALFSVSAAQVWLLPSGKDKDLYSNVWGRALQNSNGGVTWNKPVGHGNVFGTLGTNNQGLFGKAGYQGTIFNDARGKLDGQAYGTRVLSPAGDTSHFGGKLNWANENAKASVDISKQIHGKTTVDASGAGVWNVDKNTQLSAGGSLYHGGSGKPDVTVNAQIEHKF
ncbi:gloverin-like [Leguminivora glycinivorella]|uniref:gloverin-like n=1 Tax=Leguminivora glycinivorella TaxID=1035111 RepID=UPI00200C09B8|nr:gloverin-like [Leguminivora glycinivorella]